MRTRVRILPGPVITDHWTEALPYAFSVMPRMLWIYVSWEIDPLLQDILNLTSQISHFDIGFCWLGCEGYVTLNMLAK